MAATHALVDWIDDGLSSVISLSNIKEPRKPFPEYKTNDIVAAKCTGFKGLFDAKIVETSGK